MVGTVDMFPQHNLSQRILIAIHNQDMDSNPAGISNQDMDSSLVGISSPVDINSLVGINRDHMERLPMAPRAL
jgi:hypothetical protein